MVDLHQEKEDIAKRIAKIISKSRDDNGSGSGQI
jgi:hypothetical protein